jgi:hypothetical protein
MRLLLFPFFFFYLLLCLGISTLRVIADELGFMSSFLLSLGFLLVVVYLHFFKTRQPIAFLPASPLDDSPQPVQQYIQYWENMKNLQPTHRDILLNLAALYDYAGDATQAAKMKKQAKFVDPNYSSTDTEK